MRHYCCSLETSRTSRRLPVNHYGRWKFPFLDLRGSAPKNLTISNTYFATLIFPQGPIHGINLIDCVAERVVGVAGPQGVPEWAKLEADSFTSLENVARIRKAGLSPNHQILVTVVRKTFFQKGAGRKEEALLRGLGQIGAGAKPHRILNLLLTENVLRRFKGDEGFVYSPNREHASRMNKMLNELNLSEDQIWIAAGKL
jgi:hypothetical protein